MTPELWQKVKQAWEQYQQLPDEQRPSFLQRLRDEDTDVASELETLMRRHEASSPQQLQAPPAELWDELASSPPESAAAASGTVDYLSHPDHANVGDPSTVDDVPTAAPMAEDLPRQAGRYVIQNEIARGGMGAVLCAVDPDIQRTLAVKIMLPKAQGNANAQKRFLGEARITGQLQHPGIPPIHELGELNNGCPFFAMKLIEGRTLAHLLKERVSPAQELPRFIGIFGQICQTLGYAHSRGIIHRDLKPANIMVGAFGEVQVMDWGLAKQVDNQDPEFRIQKAEPEVPPKDQPAAHDGTQAGVAMGTPTFMAPEQARGEIAELDERCDVFGLGAILCQILTGKPPFQGTSIMDVLEQATAGNVGDAFARLDGCGADAELIDLAKKCLVPLKENRPASGGEIADAIGRYEEQVQERLRKAEMDKAQAELKAVEEGKRREVEQAKTWAERAKRRWTLAATTALSLLVAGAAGVVLWYQSVEQARNIAEIDKNRRHSVREQMMADALNQARKLRFRVVQQLKTRGGVFKMLNQQAHWESTLKEARLLIREVKDLRRNSEFKVAPHLERQTTELEGHLNQDDSERTLAVELEKLFLVHNVSSAIKSSALMQRYFDLFSAAGINVEKLDSDTIAVRIDQSPIREQLQMSMLNWMIMTIFQKKQSLRKKLLGGLRASKGFAEKEFPRKSLIFHIGVPGQSLSSP